MIFSIESLIFYFILLVVLTFVFSSRANVFDNDLRTCFLTVCFCNVTNALQSESTLDSCLNGKELLAQSRREVWRLNDCCWTRTQNHLVLKRTLNHLAKLAKWLSCVLSTYLYGVFNCMFLSCHVRVLEWIHTL